MPKVNKKAKQGKKAGDDESKYLTRGNKKKKKTPRDISYWPAYYPKSFAACHFSPFLPHVIFSYQLFFID